MSKDALSKLSEIWKKIVSVYWVILFCFLVFKVFSLQKALWDSMKDNVDLRRELVSLEGENTILKIENQTHNLLEEYEEAQEKSLKGFRDELEALEDAIVEAEKHLEIKG